MLLHQGAKAFEIWTGKPAPVKEMRRALEENVYWALTRFSIRIIGKCCRSILVADIFRAGLHRRKFPERVHSSDAARHEHRIAPSHCPHCKYAIPFYLNVPLLTWLVLRGRCKNCGAPISPRYFIVELLTGVAFLSCWLKFGVLGQPYPSLLIALAYCIFWPD
ncbi:MAG: prepilin peptidase [Limisphaerales bacterium]